MKLLRNIIVLIIGIVLISVNATAQSTLPRERTKGNSNGSAMKAERGRMMGTKIDPKAIPMEQGRYINDKLKELEQEMKERNWASEGTAWDEARKTNTKESYERYIAMYPYGAHSNEANKALIDIEVSNTFKTKHGQLPGMNRTFIDDDSPTSTITIENDTHLPLTVMYSGIESRSVTIEPGRKSTITVQNGQYRIAASVPSANIRPFAGTETLRGGCYEVGYIISTFSNL